MAKAKPDRFKPRVLTATYIAKVKPDPTRRQEVSDVGTKGLFLAIAPNGSRAWNWRYMRPGSGRSACLRMGRVDLSGREFDGDPKVGDPLTLASARQLAAECERQRLRGRDPAAEKQIAKKQARIVHAEKEASSFPAAARRFCDEYTVKGKGRKPKDWQWTARHLGLDYSGGGEPVLVEKGLAQRWRERPVTDVTSHDIYAVVDEAKRHGIPGMEKRAEGLSDARARKMRDSLGSMFGWLLEHRKIATDPTLGVWRPGPPAARDRKLHFKTDERRADEVRWFWSACDKVGQPFEAALKLLLLTGCRLNEVAQMRWSELSDDLAVLHLPPQRTKNGRPHDVPLPPLARELIRSVKRIEDCPFVFTTNGRTPTGSWNRVKAKLDEAMLEQARKERDDGATVEAWVLHDLRRTAASGMASLGVRSEVIERALNHVSGSFRGVAGTYQRDPLTDEVRDALVMWAEHVARVIAGTSAKVVALKRPA
jgi:integrase